MSPPQGVWAPCKEHLVELLLRLIILVLLLFMALLIAGSAQIHSEGKAEGGWSWAGGVPVSITRAGLHPGSPRRGGWETQPHPKVTHHQGWTADTV